MAKAIQIRNVPDEVHRALRELADAAGISLSDYLREELARVAERPTVSEILLRESARQPGLTVAEIVAAVRSGRDRD
jgi:plasmid stability protein